MGVREEASEGSYIAGLFHESIYVYVQIRVVVIETKCVY